jgi:hypothetical protein
LKDFISAVEGELPEVTNLNWSGLWELSGEFGFGGLAVVLSSFGFRSGWVDLISRQRILYLEERASTQNRLLSELQQRVLGDSPSVKVRGKGNEKGKGEEKGNRVVIDRLSVVEGELFQLRATVEGLNAEIKTSWSRLKHERTEFNSPAAVFKVAVVGPIGGSGRRLNLILGIQNLRRIRMVL